MENTPHNYEEKSEKFLSKEQVLEAMAHHIEGATVVRELSDEKGLYLLEAKVEGEKPGEVIQYEYMRKGRHANHNESAVTGIEVVYYRDDIPYGGDRIAEFNEETGEWTNLL